MRSKSKAHRLSTAIVFHTGYLVNRSEGSLIVALKGSKSGGASKRVQTIVILFTEDFYSVHFSTVIRDHPQISPSQPHGCRSCFFPAFPRVRIFKGLEAFRPSYPPSVVPRAWDGGCACISLPSPRFSRMPRGLDTSIPLCEPYPASSGSQYTMSTKYMNSLNSGQHCPAALRKVAERWQEGASAESSYVFMT